MADDEDNPFVKIKTYPCDQCGRKFKQESLQKHRKVCSNITKSRKIFDSGRQRADGSDVNYKVTKETRRVQIEGEKPIEAIKQTSNWREKHNDFIRSIRNAKGVTEAIRTGAPLPKFEPSAVPSDYVNCQYCGRNFNRNAAERHIPFCEQQSKRTKINNSANQKQLAKKPAPAPARKQSSEAYGSNGYNPNEYANPRGYSNTNGAGPRGGNGNAGGYGSGSGGGARKPVKYESQYNYESDQEYSNGSGGGGYSQKSRAFNQTRTIPKQQNEPILRTGRNLTNSELNALARNRSGNSQRASPKNRDASNNGRRAVQQPAARGGYGRTVGFKESPGSKFCHECGSEFPVEWAKFCSYCGSGRA
ncbi:unnamed protein product [Brachionus calyciflorus]|uniref:C2HC/C3H-type domain-containing protein n=1 Tax=Brachionus calyciflorus TaxID=104777 RepID=A0A813WL37_9BILA|nr:unnamed protein product [Brachionus calyciflorus]